MDEQLKVKYEPGIWTPGSGLRVKQHAIDRFRQRFYETAVRSRRAYATVEETIRSLFEESVQTEFKDSGGPRRWHPKLEIEFVYRIDHKGRAVIETITSDNGANSNKDELPQCPSCGLPTEPWHDPCPHCEPNLRAYKA